MAAVLSASPAPLEDRDAALLETDRGYVVRLEGFSGTVSELAGALRSRTLEPHAVDLYRLVRDYLAYFDGLAGVDLELASEALPRVAQVIELKLRLLLPRPADMSEDEADAAALEDALEAVALLEELEHAIDFLKRRRQERRLVVRARAPRPPYERPPRPLTVSKDDLARLAGRYRLGGYFEFSSAGATVATVSAQLLSRLRRAVRGLLFGLMRARDWPTKTLTFAAMLELVKQDRVSAAQPEPFGPIEVVYREEPEAGAKIDG